uniref:Uncharacterized protein AlNc14C5G749 n=1 Tax=Albugo laibachii Nc14 TaxID=890382 RepID=F0W0W9_9STRA|nr:conserved hypothetical protein [Albugo laibachii Nc14]|eukprot:CCA14693.1 conserved hypothetical protein [Albugo laibachii Nc14]
MNYSTSRSSRYEGKTEGLHRCGVAICSNAAVADGLCTMHLQRKVENQMSQSSDVEQHLSTGSRIRSCSTQSQGVLDSQLSVVAKKQRIPLPVFSSDDELMASGTSMSQDRQVEKAQLSDTSRQSTTLCAVKMGNISSATCVSDHRMTSHHSALDDSLDRNCESTSRRERNRIAARKSRQRKLDRISNLEEEKARLQQQRDRLVKEIQVLETKSAVNPLQRAIFPMSDIDCQQLQLRRSRIIKSLAKAYNTGNIWETFGVLREDAILSGTQNSSIELRGSEAIILDYFYNRSLFRDVELNYTNVECDGLRSQHFRAKWTFSGLLFGRGVTLNEDFAPLIQSVAGKTLHIEGTINFSFSGEKIAYIHRTANQPKLLSSLVKQSGLYSEKIP